MTTLRPSGKGKFGDQIIDVITEGEFISAETPIIISQIDGMRVLVARTQASS
jgi:membrane-bound serine protease (ClpP class)